MCGKVELKERVVIYLMVVGRGSAIQSDDT